MNKEESPYCEICGHCGEIGCCGISNFIDKHIKGKTNCKNEEIVISEIIDICNYETEVFKENKLLQSQLDTANKKLERVSKLKPEELAIMFHNTYEKLAPDFGYETRKDTKTFNKNSANGKLMIEVCKEILSIIGDE